MAERDDQRQLDVCWHLRASIDSTGRRDRETSGIHTGLTAGIIGGTGFEVARAGRADGVRQASAVPQSLIGGLASSEAEAETCDTGVSCGRRHADQDHRDGPSKKDLSLRETANFAILRPAGPHDLSAPSLVVDRLLAAGLLLGGPVLRRTCVGCFWETTDLTSRGYGLPSCNRCWLRGASSWSIPTRCGI